MTIKSCLLRPPDEDQLPLRRRPARRSHRLKVISALLAPVALALGTVVSAGPLPGSGGSATISSASLLAATSSNPETAAAVSKWRKLPASPLPGMQITTGVWTGRELLVYGVRLPAEGGAQPYAAAYRPSTRTWRKLATPPGRQNVEGREQAVWTGREMLVWGASANLAYNLRTNKWRHLPTVPGDSQYPAGPGGHVMVWTGKQMIIWGGGCCANAVNTGAAYTPATNSWRLLPRSPLSGRTVSGVWTGREVVIAGGSTGEGAVLRSAAAYNPSTRHWRKLPRMPWAANADAVTWDGSEVLLTGGIGKAGYTAPLKRGLAYKPATNHWRKLPAADYARVESVAVWTGHRLLVWGGFIARGGDLVNAPHGESFNPRNGYWAAIATSPLRGGRSGPVSVWTGKSMIIWGGWGVQQEPAQLFRDGAAYTP